VFFKPHPVEAVQLCAALWTRVVAVTALPRTPLGSFRCSPNPLFGLSPFPAFQRPLVSRSLTVHLDLMAAVRNFLTRHIFLVPQFHDLPLSRKFLAIACCRPINNVKTQFKKLKNNFQNIVISEIVQTTHQFSISYLKKLQMMQRCHSLERATLTGKTPTWSQCVIGAGSPVCTDHGGFSSTIRRRPRGRSGRGHSTIHFPSQTTR